MTPSEPRELSGHPSVYLFLASNDPQAMAAKISAAAASASVRIVPRGIPNSSCATLPVIIAASAAVAKAMMRKATLTMWEAYSKALRVANACIRSNGRDRGSLGG